MDDYLKGLKKMKRYKSIYEEEPIEMEEDMFSIFWEMANVPQETTGLPVIIWLDSGRTYINGGHSKRIKFQNDYGTKVNHKNLLSMTILDEEPVIYPKKAKIKIQSRDVDKIRNFVKLNKENLSKLADEEINIFEFGRLMKKV